MSQVALSGQDTILINSYLFTGLGDQNYIELTYPNNIANAKKGKNGNTIYSFNESGKLCDVKMRLLLASPDDSFMNNLLTQQEINFAGTVLMTGTFVKKVGDGNGNVTNVTYVLSGGIFIKRIEAKSNAEGETDQSIAHYALQFSNSPRALT